MIPIFPIIPMTGENDRPGRRRHHPSTQPDSLRFRNYDSIRNADCSIVIRDGKGSFGRKDAVYCPFRRAVVIKRDQREVRSPQDSFNLLLAHPDCNPFKTGFSIVGRIPGREEPWNHHDPNKDHHDTPEHRNSTHTLSDVTHLNSSSPPPDCELGSWNFFGTWNLELGT